MVQYHPKLKIYDAKLEKHRRRGENKKTHTRINSRWGGWEVGSSIKVAGVETNPPFQQDVCSTDFRIVLFRVDKAFDVGITEV